MSHKTQNMIHFNAKVVEDKDYTGPRMKMLNCEEGSLLKG